MGGWEEGQCDAAVSGLCSGVGFGVSGDIKCCALSSARQGGRWIAWSCHYLGFKTEGGIQLSIRLAP